MHVLDASTMVVYIVDAIRPMLKNGDKVHKCSRVLLVCPTLNFFQSQDIPNVYFHSHSCPSC